MMKPIKLLASALAVHQTAAFCTGINHRTRCPRSHVPLQLVPSSIPSERCEPDRFTEALQNSIAIFPIAVSAFAFAAVPFSASAGDITKGNEVFSANCVGCHRGGQNFVKEQKTLQKDALEKYVGLDEGKVTKFFKDSFVHKVVGGKLTDEEVTDVVSYVVDQAMGEKW